MKAEPLPRMCRWCAWDIGQGPDGRWRLAWGPGDDTTVDEYECPGHPGHEPAESRPL